MATIHDVAEKAKVSVMTVSRSMNNPKIVSDKTIRKIQKAMEELGYQPSHIARSLVKKKTNTLGLIMPDIKNTFFNSWFRSVETYSRLQGYHLLLNNTDENAEMEMRAIKLFQSHRVDGILIVPHSEESVKYLVYNNITFLLVDRKSSEFKTDFISTNHYLGAFTATEHLIKNGHKKIAVLKGPGELFPDTERFRGFSDAMKKYKINILPDLVRNCEFKETNANKAVTELFTGSTPPTAVFSFNSLMTIGAIKAINSLKLSMPKDVSFISFDEIPGNEIFKPNITHIQQPVEELGEKATKIIIDKIENTRSNKHYKIFLKPHLMVGESCRKIR